jgi:transposase
VVGVGVETADMLVQEIFSRNLRDRKAVARYAGLTGAPDESGKKRRERGLAKSCNARVRRGMLELAWGFLVHQLDSVLARWYRARTADARGVTRKTMIVALARKLLIALWRPLARSRKAWPFAQLRDGLSAGKDGCGFCSPPACLSLTADDDPRWRPPDIGHGLCAEVSEWARRPGASPPMRMTASWFSSQQSPPDTSLWRDVRAFMANSPRTV